MALPETPATRATGSAAVSAWATWMPRSAGACQGGSPGSLLSDARPAQFSPATKTADTPINALIPASLSRVSLRGAAHTFSSLDRENHHKLPEIPCKIMQFQGQAHRRASP